MDEVFYDLSIAPTEVTDAHMTAISKFTLLAYKSSEKINMEKARLAAVTNSQLESFK